MKTFLTALLGLALGGGLFLTLRMLPLRAIEKAERKLQEANEFLSKVMQGSTSTIAVIDRDGKIMMINRKGCELLEMKEEDILGKAVISLFTREFRDDVAVQLQLLENKVSDTVEFDAAIEDAKGETIHIACGAAPFFRKNKIAGFVLSAENITLRKQAEQQIKQLAYFDNLTGLPNRLLFNDRLERALDMAKRYNDIAAVMFIDMDNFKLVNDTLGHRIGDLLLKEVAKRLQQSIRKTDSVCHIGDEAPVEMVARLGGDEFTILLTKIRQYEDAVLVAQRIFEIMAKPMYLDGNELYATMSLGISIYPNDGIDMETLLRNADAAMYHAKSLGRNTYQFYREAMNEAATTRLRLENNLHKALERHEFQLYYQPQMDLHTGEIVGMEALIRWMQPEMGIIMPHEFIAIAEENGLIIPITEWVLNAACEQNKIWHRSGFSTLRVSVNISPQLFKSGRLPDMVAKALDAAGLESRFLELEITESIMVHNFESTMRQLQQLKEMGTFISIDDFGTGYSSFNYLKMLPIDAVKIDRSFVHELLEKNEDAAIIRAIIATAHTLNLRVVAEGVETREQLEFLSSNGCDESQGYLVSKPIPSFSATKYLREKLPTDDTIRQLNHN
jgi:diguanylate cyclase (GGDEF)-like protein/PAS domain S-box-containing protein